MATAIEFNHVGKQYRLGLVSTGTLSHDINRWWRTSILGQEDPYLKIGDVNDRASKANSDYVWALRDIDFKVEEGDVVGIIGKNGAGKSTLLKLLSKVTAPTIGTIRARGRIASLLEVGTGFHGEMTGRENIYMNGAILGMTKAEIDRKMDEIIDFRGGEKYIDTPVKRYSSGMTVRLGFAVAAFLDPEILVVDEVLAVGDAEFQKKAIGKMKDVSQGQGRTVLFVSHNMDSVLNLCNNGIVLEYGKIVKDGPISECVDYYLSDNSAHSYNCVNPPSSLYIEEAKFIGSKRSMEGLFYLDEPISMQFKIKRIGEFKECDKAIFDVAIYNQTRKITTIEQPLERLNNANEAIVTLTFPPYLFAPGSLYLEIATHIPNVEILHHIKSTCAFTVLDTGSSMLKYNGKDQGVIFLNPERDVVIR